MMNEQEKLLLFIKHILQECDGEQIDTTEYSDGYRTIAEALNETSRYIFDAYHFALNIADGDLNGQAPPRDNMLSGPFRALRSSLLHLTWQSQRVAAGDYKQHVDFMGEFSESFNSMIQQLEQREQELLKAAQVEAARANELRNNNELLLSITELVDDWIIMIDKDPLHPSFLNNAAQYGIKDYELNLSEICRKLSENRRHGHAQKWSLLLENPKQTQESLEFFVSTYPIHRNDSLATLYILRDTTTLQRKMREMEVLAYRDPITKLYNRRYCLQYLNDLLLRHEKFSLCFIDLNNLKYINDHYGHEAGDEYIAIVAEALQNTLRHEDIICRFGGDELVALLADCPQIQSDNRMQEVQELVIHKGRERGWNCSISYGIVQIAGNETINEHELIQEADQKMYEFKKLYKANNPLPH